MLRYNNLLFRAKSVLNVVLNVNIVKFPGKCRKGLVAGNGITATRFMRFAECIDEMFLPNWETNV